MKIVIELNGCVSKEGAEDILDEINDSMGDDYSHEIKNMKVIE